MKKALLSGLAMAIAISVNSQVNTTTKNGKFPQVNPSIDKAFVYDKKLYSGCEALPVNNYKSKYRPTFPKPFTSSSETVIGVTTYDLQSNSSIQNRIRNHGDGTISAVWTYSESYNLGASDRGTGYNYFDGTSWGSQPTQRIESERIGWPTIAITTGGKETIISHSTQNNVLHMDRRIAKGTGIWTSTPASASYQIWPKMAIGGSNGKTIHVFSLRNPSYLSGGPYMGVDGALLYFRSKDGGDVWDIQDSLLTGLDATKFWQISADDYAIDALGDTVVFVLFSNMADVVMMKSIDNGNTWNRTIILDFPLDLYDPDAVGTITDIDNDGVADTVQTCDGAGALVLDQNGMAHLFFGNMRNLDDDSLAGGGSQYFPFTNGLMYWNESFGSLPPVMIAGAPDMDGDGQLNFLEDIGKYYVSASGMPSAGIDANGTIYVSFSALMENLDQTVQNYRHIFITKSDDGGCSWTRPVDVTPNDIFAECVYGSMANFVDNDIHILYMKDAEPGIAVNVQFEGDPFDLNEMVYLKVPVADFDTVSIVTCAVGGILGEKEFSAGDSTLLTAPECGTAFSWSTGGTTQSIYVSVYGIVTVDITTPCGIVQRSIDLSILVGINEIVENINYLAIYPNPNKGVFNLDINLTKKETITIAIFNMQGQQVLFESIGRISGTIEKQMDLSNHSAGIYHLQIITDSAILNRKVVIE